jgi:hypothetical protein
MTDARDQIAILILSPTKVGERVAKGWRGILAEPYPELGEGVLS